MEDRAGGTPVIFRVGFLVGPGAHLSFLGLGFSGGGGRGAGAPLSS